MSGYGLEVLDKQYCNDKLLEIFSRAHMTYINQIFGDETIRQIITEVFPRDGKLVVVPSGPNFGNTVHHIYYYDADEKVNTPVFSNNNNNNATVVSPRVPTPRVHTPLLNTATVGGSNALTRLPPLPMSPRSAASVNDNDDFVTSKMCSIDYGFQDLSVDVNDTLCQSYSLMAYLSIDFDSTPSANATREQKFEKQRSMVNMYRMILNTPAFVKEFNAIVRARANKELWQDSVDEENEFFINERYKGKGKPVIDNIKLVLDIWERWGWQFFVGDGTCEKRKRNGGMRNSRMRTTRRVGRSRRTTRRLH